MSSVRVLVGTHKGAFVLTSDGARKHWKVQGPYFGGWEVYHVTASPADPTVSTRRSRAAGSARSSSARTTAGRRGRRWGTSSSTTARWARTSGTTALRSSWEFSRVWHLEPSLTDPDTIYAGIQDAALFRSTDGGQSWAELSGLRHHQTSASGRRAPAGCACTRSCSTRATTGGCTSPSRRPAPSGPTTAARIGGRSTRG